jgi:hypothetical protein
MKRMLIQALLYALTALALVIAYTQLRTFGEVEVALRDESGPLGSTGFPATLSGSCSHDMTVVRDGHICHYVFDYKTVLRHGLLGISVTYHGMRDGRSTASSQTLPLIPVQTDEKRWTPLDEHLLASATLR